LIHGFPALIKSHISCRCPGDLSMVKIHSAMDLISASSQVQSLVISVDFLRVSCLSVFLFTSMETCITWNMFF
jgi:hypothetical protein